MEGEKEEKEREEREEMGTFFITSSQPRRMILSFQSHSSLQDGEGGGGGKEDYNVNCRTTSARLPPRITELSRGWGCDSDPIVTTLHKNKTVLVLSYLPPSRPLVFPSLTPPSLTPEDT